MINGLGIFSPGVGDLQGLQQGDQIHLFVGEILERAGYRLDAVEDRFKAIIMGDRCRLQVKKLEINWSRNTFTNDDLQSLCTHFPNVQTLILGDFQSTAVTAEGIK